MTRYIKQKRSHRIICVEFTITKLTEHYSFRIVLEYEKIYYVDFFTLCI